MHSENLEAPWPLKYQVGQDLIIVFTAVTSRTHWFIDVKYLSV